VLAISFIVGSYITFFDVIFGAIAKHFNAG
jgi:hypothetical protein